VDKALSSKTLTQEYTPFRGQHKKQGHLTNKLLQQLKISKFILINSATFWAVGLNALKSGVITQKYKLRLSTLYLLYHKLQQHSL
jgi:hypothetical protein